MNNQTIETILNHKSIRKYTNEPITKEQIHTIVQAAQQASTSSYYQAYNIIGITDPTIKKELSLISGQSYVENNGHLFIFCANLNRFLLKTDESFKEKITENLMNTEHFLVATIDASLAAQNAAIAAESMGLGICYIGSLRNNIAKVDQLLNLPPFVIPLFGMTIGYPDQEPERKPRLPIEAVYSENSYPQNNEETEKYIDEFNEILGAYYENRTENNRSDTWTDQLHRKLSKPVREDVTTYVKSKGFNKK
ncbi:FMN reductase (NADPH) [Salirhabdus euzebyi]|uniref:FMN reductase (NADPH) n=1 Tax=Salirhabdus euzebyi TaxID=394506 RepID=A0A841Q8Q7_9BACI|nr:oxygen-insensitive NADPH nitroreductase [Salirhabdus euzebyi]MBB6454790.1 FMN reductase (NADPH) [Salirhabdus euzebyi]